MIYLINTYSFIDFNLKAKALFDNVATLDWTENASNRPLGKRIERFSITPQIEHDIAAVDRSHFFYRRPLESSKKRYLETRAATEDKLAPGDVVVSESVNSVVKLAIKHAAESVGAAFIIANTSRIHPGRLWWTDQQVGDFPRLHPGSATQIRSAVAMSRDDLLTARANSPVITPSTFRKIKHVSYMEEPVLRFYANQFLRRWRRKHVRAFKFDSYPDDAKRKILLMPLQYNPEVSTSTWSNGISEDDLISRLLLRSKAENLAPVVKEHPHNTGYRPTTDYIKFKNMGITVLGPDKISVDSLPEGTKVMTLNSTFGYEALKSGLPVEVLGNCFYRQLSEEIASNDLGPNHIAKLIEKFERDLEERSSDGYFDPAIPAMNSQENIKMVIKTAMDLQCKYYT